MVLELEDLLKSAKITFYTAMTIGVIILAYQWATFDDDLNSLGNDVIQMLDKVQCQIDFKDFHYLREILKYVP